MVGRNRRVRILALALFGFIAFVLYSRSSASYEEYKQYAEKKYEDAVGRAGRDGSASGVGGGAVIRPPGKDDEKEKEAAGLLEAAESAAAAVVRTTSTTVIRSTSSRKIEDVAAETTSSAAVATSTMTSSSNAVPEPTALQGLPAITYDDYLPQEGGEGRVEVEVPLQQSTTSAIHWTSSAEHFPVSTTIQLPTNKPSPIPKIQHDFKEKEDKGADLDRLAVIKAAATHAWYGYREKAWGQDEIMPLSGSYKNPFNAWGATLVDALDTLWILGMKAEFDEAVEFVETIDFTTTPRADIPLFETTIRYLGGLLAAYDVSGKKHRILLEKAVELGEVLYGAFDTPNRMPQTYYHWKPAFASQPHRASSRVVLAELGSLSMEFTRLAQLTGEPKYYDAIARITDGFYVWQNNTRVPGMWPTYIDASGCGKPAQMSTYTGNGISLPAPNGDGMMSADQPVKVEVDEKVLTEAEKAVNKKYQENSRKQAEAQGSRIAKADTARKEGGIVGKIVKEDDTSTSSTVNRNAEKAELRASSEDTWSKSKEGGVVGKIRVEDDTVAGKQKRQLDDYAASKPTTGNSTRHQEPPRQQPRIQQPQIGAEVCIPKGLDSPSTHGQETYTLAGMSDSTYEYLPKMHLLLAGRVEEYKEMYLASADTAIERLIYRPMIKDDWDILAAGDLTSSVNGSSLTLEMIETFKPVNSHLVCFAGGMFAMGGKIFDRPDDVEIGRKLTNGCVWSYNVTVTGIMPEDFWLSKCDSMKDCLWNETKYWEELDPYREQRTKVYTHGAAPMTDMPTLPGVAVHATKTVALQAAPTPKDMEKRQLDSDSTADDVPGPLVTSSTSPTKTGTLDVDTKEAPNNLPVKTYDIAAHFEDPGANTVPHPPAAAVYTPPPPMSHKEFVEHKIAAERLPPGFTKITSKSYILRPEAIESVFYMYRITGEQYWRDRGWEMFTAVQDHTRTVWGNSAIDDVTKAAPEMKDSEESFWLAETLKYFYLLFDEPDKWSLDDWVLNTEAHFFKRAG